MVVEVVMVGHGGDVVPTRNIEHGGEAEVVTSHWPVNVVEAVSKVLSGWVRLGASTLKVPGELLGHLTLEVPVRQYTRRSAV